MKVIELMDWLKDMDDDAVLELAIHIEGESAWWDCEIDDMVLDKKHVLLRPTEIVMR